MFFVGGVDALSLTLESPTPADSVLVNQTNAYINISVTDSASSQIIVDYEEDLLLYVDFDTNNGTDPLDRSDYNKSIYFVDGTKSFLNSTSGKFGTFGSFRGNHTTASYLHVEDTTEKLYGDMGEISASFWIQKPSEASLTEDGIISNFASPIIIRYDSNANRIDCKYSNTTTTATSLNVVSIEGDGWHNVVCIYNGTSVYTYVDGVIQASMGSLTGKIKPTTLDLYIGSSTHNSDHSANADIDEVAIWSRALSETEVLGIYNASANNYKNNFTFTMNDNYLFKYYAINESGTLVNGSLNVSINSSGLADYQNIIYVDNNNINCSDIGSYNRHRNPLIPACTIARGVGALNSSASVGDTLWVRNGTYTERIDMGGLSGESDLPYTIQGESNSVRTIINSGGNGDGIDLDGEDNLIFQYFEVVDSEQGDGINVHLSSKNLTFRNITVTTVGSSGGYGVLGTGIGDGISFHEDATSWAYNLDIFNSSKGCVVDIGTTMTNYSNLNCSYSEDFGILFYNGLVYNSSEIANPSGLGTQRHYLYDVEVEQSPFCIMSAEHVYADGLTCDNNSLGVFYNYSQIWLQEQTNFEIYNFTINNTPSGFDSIRLSEGAGAIFQNGVLDNAINVTNASVVLINVTYNISEENVNSDANLTRKWYFDSSTNVNNTNITITNSTGSVVYSSLVNGSIARQILIQYINLSGTSTDYSNHTISASATGYVTNITAFNLTNNTNVSFTLVETPADETTDTSTSTGSAGKPSYSLTASRLAQGYSQQLAEGWKLKFNAGGG